LQVIEIFRQPVVNGALPVGPRQGRALGIGDRHDGLAVVFAVDRREVRNVEPAMQRGHTAARMTPRPWEMQIVAVEMHDVEVTNLLDDALEQDQMVREHVDASSVQAQGAGADGDEFRGRLRVAGGKQRHLVPLSDEFFSEIRDDTLGSAIKLRRNALVEGRNNCDFHRSSLPNGSSRESLSCLYGRQSSGTQPVVVQQRCQPTIGNANAYLPHLLRLYGAYHF